MQDEQEPTIEQIEKEVASKREADSGQDQESSHGDTTLVAWTASEYIAHKKNLLWYIALGGIVTLVAGTIFLLTGDPVSSIVVVIAGLLFGVFALRQPEVRSYEVRPSGIVISDKLFPYGMFISFAIHEQQALQSIFLMPAKRFMPGITIYYPREQEDTIVEALSVYLPLEDSEPDMIARLMSRVRF